MDGEMPASYSSSIWACGVDNGHFAGAAIERGTDGTYRTYGTNVDQCVRVDRCSDQTSRTMTACRAVGLAEAGRRTHASPESQDRKYS